MKTAICLIVRNEARDIREWMAHHALLGFDTQIIFDNGSLDGTADIIKAARARYDIRFHNWENRSRQSQTLAYEAACRAYRLEFEWIAFVDSDEFLMLESGESIGDFLARFGGWGAIALNWAVYGSAGHDAYPDGLVLENFLTRADEKFFPARHVKSILRPRLASGCPNPHYFHLDMPAERQYCDAAGVRAHWFTPPEAPNGLPGVSAALPDYAIARVNHYFTRSRAHWQAKLDRGYPSDVAIRKMEEFDIYDRNEVTDPIGLRNIDRLRDEVAKLKQEEELLF